MEAAKGYFLTGIHTTPDWELKIGKENKTYGRCFGWFEELTRAIEYAEKNIGDMNEAGFYSHLVIEEIESDIIHPIPRECIWYKFDRDQNKWVELSEAPKFAEGKFNFSGVG